MAIPMNTTDTELAAKQAEAIFADEVERIENHIFSQKWESEHYAEYIRIGTMCLDSVIGIKVYPEHWDAVVRDVKGAGYYVYRQYYHNGHYGYTKVSAYYITKAPLNTLQRAKFTLQDEFSTPWGPGRECRRGEML